MVPPLPPRKPRRFIKADSKESDYESDLESKILPRWVPPGSDTEETTYKKVKPKLWIPETADAAEVRDRWDRVTKEPTPPSQFDQVPIIEGPPRPVVLHEGSLLLERNSSVTESTIQFIRKETCSSVKSTSSLVKSSASSSVAWPPPLKSTEPEVFSVKL